MATLVEFGTKLATSSWELVQTMATTVATNDPLSAVLLVGGALLTAGASAALGYLALGAAADAAGI